MSFMKRELGKLQNKTLVVHYILCRSFLQQFYVLLLFTYFIISTFHVFCPSLYSQETNRSSHRRWFVKRGVFKNFAKFTGKHLRYSVFFNKVAGLLPSNLSKKRLWRRCFPVNFAKFLRTPLLESTSKRLFLNLGKTTIFLYF